MEQFADQMLSLKHFLRKHTHREGLTRGEKKNVVNQSKTHFLQDGVLMYNGGAEKRVREVITSRQRVHDILYQNHSSAVGGHSGIGATRKKISQKFWWNGMQKDVEEYVASCGPCQCFVKLKTQAPELKSIKVTEPMELVGMDSIASDLLDSGRTLLATTTKMSERRERMEEFAKQMSAVVTYLRTGKHKPGFSRTQQKNTLNQCRTHFLRGGVLFYRGPEEEHGPEREVLTSAERIDEILRLAHSPTMGRHFGVTATVSKVTKRYWWKGIKKDVDTIVSSCETCQGSHAQKPKTHQSPPPLKHIDVGEPLELVGMDLIGPFMLTDLRHQYVLTMTDYYTKWVDLFPLATKQVTEVCRAIKKFVTRWGAPKVILSDEGRKFVNEFNKEQVCSTFGICCAAASEYDPQCLDKQSKQTVKTRLDKLVSQRGMSWDNFLDDVAFSLRTQPQESMKCSPFFLMFGRHPRHVSEAAHDVETEDAATNAEMILEDAASDAEMRDTAEILGTLQHVSEENVRARVDLLAQDVLYQKVKENQDGAQDGFQRRATEGLKSFHRRNMDRKGGAMNRLRAEPYRVRTTSLLNTMSSSSQGQQSVSMTPSQCQQSGVMTSSQCQQSRVMTSSQCQQSGVMTPSQCQQSVSMTPSQCQQSGVMTSSQCQQSRVMTSSQCQQSVSMTPSQCQQSGVMTPSQCQQNSAMTPSQGQQKVFMAPSREQPPASSAPKQSTITFLHMEKEQKPYQCGLCFVMFSSNGELDTHMGMHSLTKPYQCGYCKASYDSNPELSVHVQTHTV
ncbi:hypothetical protein V1264_003559 [Littorina saxatilis]|uniref:Integrase catalytic domain-containing protein n=1 Tax=Littorina saxatilis TaxID=31220 RepID=A0AAN9B5W5_9CAEN